MLAPHPAGAEGPTLEPLGLGARVQKGAEEALVAWGPGGAEGIKTDAVRKILDVTMTKDLKDRLFVIMAAGKIVRGKRGSDEAAADKML